MRWAAIKRAAIRAAARVADVAERRPGRGPATGTLHVVDPGALNWLEETARWHAPHPPGTHFNIDPRTRCEVVGSHTLRFHLPAPDGLALGKLRAVHLMSSAFWDGPGFGYERQGSGEGHW